MKPAALACLLFLAACGGPPETRLDEFARLDEFERQAGFELRQGNNRAALASAERGLALAGRRADPVWLSRFRLRRAEALCFLGRADDALADLAHPLPDSPEFAELRLRRQLRLGHAYMAKGNYDEAGKVLAEASKLGAGSPAVAVEAATFRGACLARTGRAADAEAVFEAALERVRDLGDAYLEAALLLNFGFLRQMQFRYDEAASMYLRVTALAREDAKVLYAAGILNLSICQARLGEFDKALDSGRTATTLFESAGARLQLQQALGEMGNTYLVKGEPVTGIPYLKRALEIAHDLKRNREAAIWSGSLAAAHTLLSDWDSAERFNIEATRIKKASGSRTLVYNVLNSARIAMGRGGHDDAVQLYRAAIAGAPEDPSVLWDSHAGLGALFFARADRAMATRHFEAALEVIEKTRADLLRTDSKVTFLNRLIRFYRDYVESLIQTGQSGKALSVADSSRTQLLGTAVPAHRARPAPANFQAAARGSNAIFLSYWLAPTRSYVWVVTPNEVVCLPLAAASHQIERLANEYRSAVEQSLVDPMRFRNPAGARLYEILIAPVRKWIPDGSRVVIVPDGALHNLSFEMLPIYDGTRPRYLIEDMVVSVAPSIPGNVLPRTKAPASLLLVGDPDRVDPEFPKLRYAGGEIDSIAGHFQRRVLVLRGARATPASFLESSPENFLAIHFSAHATANRESPLDSALILAGEPGRYKLYARDLLKSRLAADLVTISACRGAGARTYSGEGLIGFAWALLHAGARNVIAGLWDVNDRSTAELMDVVYARLASGAGPAVALREAKLRLIRSAGNFRKPYYWSPFQHYVAPR